MVESEWAAGAPDERHPVDRVTSDGGGWHLDDHDQLSNPHCLQVSADPADTPETNDLQKENADLRREIENLYRTKLFRFAAFPRRIYGAIRR